MMSDLERYSNNLDLNRSLGSMIGSIIGNAIGIQL